MKLVKVKVLKESHGIELQLYCPECNGEREPFVLLDLIKVRPVTKDYQKSVILKAKCPKCRKTYLAVIRIN